MLDQLTTIELAANSAATVSTSPIFSDRIAVRFFDHAAWASFGLELTPDSARQLAAALVAYAEAAEDPEQNSNSLAPKATPPATATKVQTHALLEVITAHTMAGHYLRRSNFPAARRKVVQLLKELQVMEVVA